MWEQKKHTDVLIFAILFLLLLHNKNDKNILSWHIYAKVYFLPEHSAKQRQHMAYVHKKNSLLKCLLQYLLHVVICEGCTGIIYKYSIKAFNTVTHSHKDRWNYK